MIKRTIPPIDETPEQRIERLEKAVSAKDLIIERQLAELLFLRRRFFGRSSERFIPDDPGQLKLAFDGMESLEEEKQVAEEEKVITYTRKKEEKKRPVREAIPAHLRRELVVIEPENIPDGAVRIGEEVTEKLEYKPGEVYVLRTERPK